MQLDSALASSRRRFILAALPLVLAVWGQWALLTQRLALDGTLLFSVGAVLFVRYVAGAHRLVPRPAASDSLARVGARLAWSVQRTPLLSCLACALLAWLFSDGNRFRAETVAFWLLACVFYIQAFWEKHGAGRPKLLWSKLLSCGESFSLSWPTVLLGLVILLGAFYRYYQIGTIPAEMTSDHAEKLLDIRDVLDGQHRIFFPRNTGREPLQFYMAVPFVIWLGLGHLALKLLTATVSLATVPVVYLIGKEIAGAKFGLLAAFFLAVSMWDVAIGRVGLRFPYYPFFSALAFFFLLRALRHGRRNDYLLCGLATGAGLYGYSPFRAMLLLIPACLAVKIVFDGKPCWSSIRPVVANAALCFGAVAVVLIPLAHYMVENPGMFWFRALTRVTSTEAPIPANPAAVLLGNVINALLMFNWKGDVVWVNTIPHDPVLDYVSGGLFVLGVVWSLQAIVKQREPVAAYLLVALFVLMLPSILSIAFPGENPSVVRSGGATPIVSLLVAVPVYLTAKRLPELWPHRTGVWLCAAMIVVLLSLTARVNFDRYFIDYATQYRQSARNSSEIAAVIDGFARSVGSRQNAFIKSWPYWVDTRNVAFNMGDPDWNNVLMTSDDVMRHPAPAGNKLYIVNKDDLDAIQKLQQRFPEGQLWLKSSAVPGQEFIVFFVAGRP